MVEAVQQTFQDHFKVQSRVASAREPGELEDPDELLEEPQADELELEAEPEALEDEPETEEVISPSGTNLTELERGLHAKMEETSKLAKELEAQLAALKNPQTETQPGAIFGNPYAGVDYAAELAEESLRPVQAASFAMLQEHVFPILHQYEGLIRRTALDVQQLQQDAQFSGLSIDTETKTKVQEFQSRNPNATVEEAIRAVGGEATSPEANGATRARPKRKVSLSRRPQASRETSPPRDFRSILADELAKQSRQ